MNKKLDILAFGAHPDDVELSAGGTLAMHVAMGRKAGICDLTAGELGTRGNAETRASEAAEAARILGLTVRENLRMADGFFANDRSHQLKVIQIIRRYRPDIVLANAVNDRHTDHGRGAQLVADACFLSGLARIETEDEDELQSPWRPRVVYHYVQDRFIVPQIVVPITEYWQTKMDSVMAFRSQFYDPESREPQTPISGEDFIRFLEGRARDMGRYIGAEYAEGFTTLRPSGIRDLQSLL